MLLVLSGSLAYPVSRPGAMRTDSRQYGFLYWVKRAFLGALAAYLLLSGCPWFVFHPVSFLLTFMVHSMQALGLASGPAAVDVNGPPATSPDLLACAGYDGAHPRMRTCFSGPGPSASVLHDHRFSHMPVGGARVSYPHMPRRWSRQRPIVRVFRCFYRRHYACGITSLCHCSRFVAYFAYMHRSALCCSAAP